jgi:hypothetical protein
LYYERKLCIYILKCSNFQISKSNVLPVIIWNDMDGLDRVSQLHVKNGQSQHVLFTISWCIFLVSNSYRDLKFFGYPKFVIVKKEWMVHMYTCIYFEMRKCTLKVILWVNYVCMFSKLKFCHRCHNTRGVIFKILFNLSWKYAEDW